MTQLLRWDKPEKVMNVEEWKSISADGAPPGVYMPNMSRDDAEAWKATLKGARSEPQVEIRKSFGGVNLTIAVGLDGYDYKTYKRDGRWSSTRGRNVHVAMNGPLQLTFAQLHVFATKLDLVVEEAEVVLRTLPHRKKTEEPA